MRAQSRKRHRCQCRGADELFSSFDLRRALSDASRATPKFAVAAIRAFRGSLIMFMVIERQRVGSQRRYALLLTPATVDASDAMSRHAIFDVARFTRKCAIILISGAKQKRHENSGRQRRRLVCDMIRRRRTYVLATRPGRESFAADYRYAPLMRPPRRHGL